MSTDDFFRTRLDTMIDMHHPLAVLATRMPWDVIEGALAPVLAHKDRAGRTVEGADLVLGLAIRTLNATDHTSARLSSPRLA